MGVNSENELGLGSGFTVMNQFPLCMYVNVDNKNVFLILFCFIFMKDILKESSMYTMLQLYTLI